MLTRFFTEADVDKSGGISPTEFTIATRMIGDKLGEKFRYKKATRLFSSLDVTRTTPEGFCFEAIEKDLIPGNSNQDSYFINYSDGQPYYSNGEIEYSGVSAENHTRKMVSNMRAKGISVLSYFIGGDYSYDSDTDCSENISDGTIYCNWMDTGCSADPDW